jgi:hypothetical protein
MVGKAAGKASGAGVILEGMWLTLVLVCVRVL